MVEKLLAKTDPSRSVGAHLRHWRQHRRLSQLELALQADVSGRHLSFIESGRAQPSRAMILKLAKGLTIPARDVNEILQAGGFANAYPLHNPTDQHLKMPMQAVQKMLDAHDAYPAFAINRQWEVIAHNRAFELFYASVDPALLRPPINILRLCLHPKGIAPRIRNLREMAAFIFARLERDVDRTADPSLIALKEELAAYVGNIHGVHKDAVTVNQDVTVPLRLSTQYGDIALLGMITVFGTPNDITLSELALETFFPADEATEQILAKLKKTRNT